MNGRKKGRTLGGVLQAIKRLFGAGRSERPILLRLEGMANGAIQIEATWFPSGLQYVRSTFVSQSMCILPWMANEDRVQIRLKAQHAHAELALHHKDTSDGSLHAVRMIPVSDAPPG